MHATTGARAAAAAAAEAAAGAAAASTASAGHQHETSSLLQDAEVPQEEVQEEADAREESAICRG